MCNEAKEAGNLGEQKVQDRLSDIRYQYRHQHKIAITKPIMEQEPFDIGLYIDGKSYSCQTKTATNVSPKGSMTFDTCKRDGQAYKPGEIDFFILYCIENKWFGIALPSECKTSTEIWLHRNPSEVLRVAQDFDFERRLCELMTEKEIMPLMFKEKTGSEPYVNWPKTTNEFIEILREYGMDELEANEITGIPISSFRTAKQDWLEQQESQYEGVQPI